MTLPNRSPSVEKRSAAARLTPRSIFSYWRLTWRRLTAVFGPPLLVLLVGIVAHEGTAKIASTRADGRRSRAVTDAADQLVAILTNAETGQRGFLLTDNDDYLHPYLRAVDSVSIAISRLRDAVASIGPSPATNRDVDSLALLSNQKMAEIAESIRLRRTANVNAALALVKTNRGLDIMRDVRRIAGAVRDHEAGRLSTRSAELTQYTTQVTWIIVLGTGAAFLIALLVNVLLARDAAMQTRLASERDEALGAVIDSNSQLADARLAATDILESIGDAFFALDKDWRFIYLNENAEPLVNRTRAELLGTSIWDAFPEIAGSTFEHEYRRAIRDQVVAGFEEYFEPLDKWFQVRAYPSRRGLAVYFTDVSSRVHAERSFRALAETMPQLVWSMNASGESEYFNGRWLAYTGADASTPDGADDGEMDWRDALHPAFTDLLTHVAGAHAA